MTVIRVDFSHMRADMMIALDREDLCHGEEVGITDGVLAGRGTVLRELDGDLAVRVHWATVRRVPLQ